MITEKLLIYLLAALLCSSLLESLLQHERH